jgi:serine protease AprX
VSGCRAAAAGFARAARVRIVSAGCASGPVWQRALMAAMLGAVLLGAAPQATAARLDPALQRAAAAAPVEVIIQLDNPAPVRPAVARGFEAKVGAMVEALRAAAAQRQERIEAGLRRRGAPHRSFWIANAIAATVDESTLRWLAAQPEVVAIARDVPVRQPLPRPGVLRAKSLSAIEWGVARVNAPQVWAMGFVGQGIVLAGQDSGYQWNHPALQAAYRGWNGMAAVHDHHWHDAIHGGAVNSCGFDAAEPCDDNNHGTHTMGTMVGDDGGANQIGVAPGARWIGCRNMNQGVGTPSTYLECFQWFIAPTDRNGANPQPALAPHVINNSWGCPPSEGCVMPGVLEEAVSNTHAAGIFVVVSAGNEANGGIDDCGTVVDPPAIYADAFSVGATNSSDVIASFSSRGPVTVDGSGRLKPDVAAPGVSVRSALRGSAYGTFSGTSMAGPHVAGVAALMMSANPSLVGDPVQVAALLRATAIGTFSQQSCGAFPGSAVPNAVFGHGRVDALAAVQAALALPLFRDGFE